jgi:hypothetical protein
MMQKPKLGKTAKDIFAATTAAPAPTGEPRPGPGRPALHDEAWSKVTVVLLNRHIVFLDRLATNIRERTGTAIKRAEIIRALIDVLAESDLDLTSATSAAELKALLAAQQRPSGDG